MKLLLQITTAALLLCAVCAFVPTQRTVEEYGTFNQGNWIYVPDRDGSWYWQDLNDLGTQPKFNADNDVTFYLFTRHNPTEGQIVKLMDLESLDASHYDKSKPTRFFAHGWLGNITQVYTVVKPYMEAGDFNLFIVDWGTAAQDLLYPVAAKRTKDVGVTIAKMINFWFKNERLNSFDDVIISGISLGAHVAGIAGKNTMEKVKAIYGLDPAGPLFFVNKPDNRFDRDDAKLTVALRTNAGPFAFGFGFPLAQMEFMPNGGKNQPGCKGYMFSMCSHARSLLLFNEALNSQNFISAGCKSFDEVKQERCTHTGFVSTFVAEDISNIPGIYYFITDYASPFGLGPSGVPT